MQRRRRKKAAPKNVFGTGSQSSPSVKKSSKTKPATSHRRTPQRAPPSVPGAKTKSPLKQSEPVLSKVQPIGPVSETTSGDLQSEEIPHEPVIKEEIPEDLPEEIVEEQILGTKKKEKQAPKSKESDIGQTEVEGRSLKAREIIQNSMIKASKAAAKELKEAADESRKSDKPESKETSKKPQKKFRTKVSSYQPAARAKRLDRSRHMEYKYEMRGLLDNIGVAEEHRSNLLATIWARGERQTILEAKNFLDEKLNEGIIDKDQLKTLEKIVDGYTIRR